MNFYVRTGSMIAVLLVMIFFIAKNYENLLYFMKAGSAPYDLGNIREKKARGEEIELGHNSYVKLEGAVISRVAEAGPEEKKLHYFFCPLYNVIFQTLRPLPEPSVRMTAVNVPETLVYLIERKMIFVEDFASSFSGEGRLLKMRQAPERLYERLKDFYAGQLARHNIVFDEVWLLKDGETPSTQAWYGAGVFGGIVVSIFVIAMFFVSLKRKLL
ncbi:MAG: hypothetical protein FJ088_04775 [Deltaproteobacteria bacterium]|nr:hypothetical protein [Deltaproteobacteria bacterium]